jgi:hypothetical protein
LSNGQPLLVIKNYFLAAGFLATAFLAAGFLAAGFLTAGFLAAGFLTAGFLATGFLAAGFFATGIVIAPLSLVKLLSFILHVEIFLTTDRIYLISIIFAIDI